MFGQKDRAKNWIGSETTAETPLREQISGEAFDVRADFELPTVANRQDILQQFDAPTADVDPESLRIALNTFLQSRVAIEAPIAREKKIADHTFKALVIGTLVTAFSKLSFLSSLNPFLFLSAAATWGYRDGLSGRNESLVVGLKKTALVALGITILNVVSGLVFSVGVGVLTPAALGAFAATVALPYFFGWNIGQMRGNHLSRKARK